MNKTIIILACLFISSVFTFSQAAPQYSIIDLGSLGVPNFTASSINDNGQIAGYGSIGGIPYYHAILYDGTEMIDLGTLGGTHSSAYSINNSGHVVGSSINAEGDHHAFLYDGGSMIDLGTLGGHTSTSKDINDSGLIVGMSKISGNLAMHAFLYNGFSMIDLGTLGWGDSVAYGINNIGQVVGRSETRWRDYHAFFYNGSSMIDLGTLGDYSHASDINNNGQIVGQNSTSKSTSYAFLYEDGMMTLLGNLGGKHSSAVSINDKGQVVGYSEIIKDSYDRHAFLYDEIRGMTNLNNLIPSDSGWVLEYASDINSSGQIVGHGIINGKERSFLLTPIESPVINVSVIYVDDSAVGDNDGSSWENAYNNLYDAFDASEGDDKILVAGGIYKPETTGLNNPRKAAFRMKYGVTIEGGFAGYGAEDPNERNVNVYETILSGDLLGNDNSDTPVEHMLDDPSRADNSYHVFYHPGGINLDETAILDGFTITAGNANNSSKPYIYTYGAGMHNNASKPTVINCTFIRNSAYGRGGGIHNRGCSTAISNCTFTANWAHSGGAMENNNSNVTVVNCAFIDNSANYVGGMYNTGNACDDNIATVTNCSFIGNSAVSGAGGIHNYYFNSIVTNCIFIDNSAGSSGGAMANTGFISVVTNCTFTGNSAGHNGGGISIRANNSTLNNCILWGNIASLGGNEIALRYTATIEVDHCDIQGGLDAIYDDSRDNTINWGEGIIDIDPLFADPNNGDVHLSLDSLCIDAGDNSVVTVDTDLDGNPRIIDGDEDGEAIVDMGAYEANYIEVSMKLTPQTLSCTSEGNFVKAHFFLPEEVMVEDIDIDTPAVIYSLGITSIRLHVFITDDGFVAVNAVFDRAEVCSSIPYGDVELSAAAFLTTGQTFYGTDTIRVTTNKFQQLLDFSAHWLRTDCTKPDWCEGFDLNQNGVVDLADFALLDEY